MAFPQHHLLLFTAGAFGSLCARPLLPALVKHVPVGRITLVSLGLVSLLLTAFALTFHVLVSLLLCSITSNAERKNLA